MISLIRTVFTMIVTGIATLLLGGLVIIADLIGVPHHKGGMYDKIPRFWCRLILWAAGTKVYAHGVEQYQGKGPFVFTSNHVSLFDIPALQAALPQHYFLAKTELFDIPIFGKGIRAVGTIPIERNNRKAAFGAYTVASDRIRNGSSVVVFPEGTRGLSYDIRPFKKGPFVLAAEAGVPIVPCIVHGTMERLPKKSLRARPGRVDVHLLDAIPTTGYTYEQRDELATIVHDRMDAAMRSLYPNP